VSLESKQTSVLQSIKYSYCGAMDLYSLALDFLEKVATFVVAGVIGSKIS